MSNDNKPAAAQEAVAEVVQNEAGQVVIVFSGNKSVIDHVGAKFYAAPVAAAPGSVALRTALETLEQIATAPDDKGAKFNAASCVAFLTTQGAAGQEWQPIETAPEGRLVVVGWLDTEDSHYPENYDFDYLEDGLWAKHEDCVEHAHAVAPPGSQMPKEQPPYQWWMDLPAFPAARPQGVKDA